LQLPGFDELFAAADARNGRLTIAAAGAADPTVLEALACAHKRGWVQPILVGPIAAIESSAAAAKIDIAPFRVVDACEPAATAVAEVRAGRAQILMKGQVDTPALMRAVLDPDWGLRTGRTISQVVLMQIDDQNRRFLLADTGVTIEPTLAQKAEILESLIAVARCLGFAAPRVALLAATEKPTESMPDTLDSAELARRHRDGQFAGAIIQGPLSFDLAYSGGAGVKKQIGGEVVGAADALLFPNLVAANLTVKAMMYTAQCRFGGILCGAACPVVFMSRADSVQTRLNSLAIALKAIVPAPS